MNNVGANNATSVVEGHPSSTMRTWMCCLGGATHLDQQRKQGCQQDIQPGASVWQRGQQQAQRLRNQLRGQRTVIQCLSDTR